MDMSSSAPLSSQRKKYNDTTYLVEAGVFLRHSSHANSSPDAWQSRVVGRKQWSPFQSSPTTPPGVVLPIPANDRLVPPSLEKLAPFVAKTFLSSHQHAEIQGHLGGHRGLDLDDDPAKPFALHSNLKEEPGII